MSPIPNRRYSVLNPNITEYFGQPLYDTANYAAAGQAAVNFFAIPRGQGAFLIPAVGIGAAVAGVIKTYRDTNMDVAGFTPDKRWELMGMNWSIRKAADLITDEQDRKWIAQNTWWHFRIGDKDVLYLPTVLVPLVNFTASTTWGAQSAHAMGANAPIYRFSTPLTINMGERLAVSLEAGAAVAITIASDITVVLHGTMQRAT